MPPKTTCQQLVVLTHSVISYINVGTYRRLKNIAAMKIPPLRIRHLSQWLMPKHTSLVLFAILLCGIAAPGVAQDVADRPDAPTLNVEARGEGGILDLSWEEIRPQVSAGTEHTCAVYNGAAKCWGVGAFLGLW